MRFLTLIRCFTWIALNGYQKSAMLLSSKAEASHQEPSAPHQFIGMLALNSIATGS
jgi:hypothetical protein